MYKHTTSVHNASCYNLWIQVNKKSTDLVKAGDSKKIDTDYGALKIKFGQRRNFLEYVIDDPKITHNQTVASHNSYIIKEEIVDGTRIFKFIEAMYGLSLIHISEPTRPY